MYQDFINTSRAAQYQHQARLQAANEQAIKLDMPEGGTLQQLPRAKGGGLWQRLASWISYLHLRPARSQN